MLVGLLLITTTPAFAMTQQEIQSKIQELIQRVQVLQAQLGVSNSISSVAAPWIPLPSETFCFTFTQNLKVGDGSTGTDGKDADVLALQNALKKEGFTINDSEQKGGAEFGESTAAAVVQFQGKYGIVQTGYVGPLTRAKLNALYKCSSPVVVTNTLHLKGEAGAPITLEEWVDYQSPFVVSFESTLNKFLQDYKGKVNVVVKHFPLGIMYPLANKAAEATECVAAQGQYNFWAIHNWLLGEGSSDWTIDSLKTYVARSMPAGFSVSDFNSCLDNGKKTDVVSAYVAEGKSKNINGVPTIVVIKNGDKTTQTISGAVSYNEIKKVVDKMLGDVTTSSVTVTSPNKNNILTPGTNWTIKWFDPAYVPGVMYTVFITDSNGGAYGIAADDVYGTSFVWNVGTIVGGKIAPMKAGENYYYIQVVRQTDPKANSGNSPFQIASSVSTPSVTILSPNGGETWTRGTTQTIKWRNNSTYPTCPSGVSCSPSAPKTFDISMTPYQAPCPVKSFCTTSVPSPIMIAKGVSGSGMDTDLSYSWNVGSVNANAYTFTSGVPDGAYYARVCVSGSDQCDTSDSYFKITSGIIATSTPSINIISPNGGETFSSEKGGFTARWNSGGQPINLYLISSGLGVMTGSVLQTLGTNLYGDSFSAVVDSIYLQKNVNFFKLKACLSNDISMCDTSDAYFSFVSSSPTVPTCSGTQQTVSEGPLGNPGGMGPFEKLGMDISAHPEILKYRIQWFNGGWSDWYVPGVGDQDSKNNIDGTPRRMWSYFDDHTHEYVTCGASIVSTPVVSGVTGPQQLTAGEQGTWKINAYDPNGGSLSYSVVWGDETSQSGNSVSARISSVPSQSATFTHSYATMGSYSPTFTVTNSGGKSVQTSLSVNVVGNVVPTVNHNPMLNPMVAPATILAGKSSNFTFSATDADGDDLSWSISWGDGTASAGACAANVASGNKRNWSYSESHVWQNSGTYPVSFSVSDCKGGSVSNGFTVDVISPTIIYPTTPSTPTRMDATQLQSSILNVARDTLLNMLRSLQQ